MAVLIAWLIVNDLFGSRLTKETKVLGYIMIMIGVISQLYMQIKILFL
jgi:hypothetical protein